MEAVVNLKLRPQEFDLIREALESYENQAHEEVTDRSIAASERAEARTLEARCAELLLALGR
jgi:hypothetical protein